MAAVIGPVTAGGSFARSAAIANGTFMVDHAGPLDQSPRSSGACGAPTGDSAMPTVAGSVACNSAKSDSRLPVCDGGIGAGTGASALGAFGSVAEKRGAAGAATVGAVPDVK